MIMKILLDIGKNQGEQILFVPNTFEGLRVGATPGKVFYFYCPLRWGTVFPEL